MGSRKRSRPGAARKHVAGLCWSDRRGARRKTWLCRGAEVGATAFAPHRLLGLIVRRELRLDDRPHRQLALADTATSHAGARPHQGEVAAHEPARTLQIAEHLAGVVGDRLLVGAPRTPAAPTPTPAPAAP